MSTASPTTQPVETWSPTGDTDVEPDLPWIVLVWNDPINLMSYVTFVFQKLFGYSLEKATSLMLDVHEKGRAVVSNGATREGRARRVPPPRARPVGHHATRRLIVVPSSTPRAVPPSPTGPTPCACRPTSVSCSPASPTSSTIWSTPAPTDPLARRLFPPAYPDDPEREAAYELLAGEELRSSRRAALEVMRTTATSEVLTESEVTAWLQSVNALRLVLGTRLDVSEDEHGRRRPDRPGGDGVGALPLPHVPARPHRLGHER